MPISSQAAQSSQPTISSSITQAMRDCLLWTYQIAGQSNPFHCNLSGHLHLKPTIGHVPDYLVKDSGHPAASHTIELIDGHFGHLDLNEGNIVMQKNRDWTTWDADFGPSNMEEAKALKAVVEGAERAGPFTGAWSPNKNGWLISRHQQRPLRLDGDASRKGFVQFLWYYTSGQRAWRKAPRTLEALFGN